MTVLCTLTFYQKIGGKSPVTYIVQTHSCSTAPMGVAVCHLIIISSVQRHDHWWSHQRGMLTSHTSLTKLRAPHVVAQYRTTNAFCCISTPRKSWGTTNHGFVKYRTLLEKGCDLQDYMIIHVISSVQDQVI